MFADTVIGGQYKGGSIKLKGFKCRPTLIKNGFLSTTRIPLNKDTVSNFEVIETSTCVGTSTYKCEITFSNGNVSYVYLSNTVYNAIFKELL